MVELLKSKDITREELGAAYLTFIFKAKLTQTGLSCAIELFNCFRSINNLYFN